MSNLQIARLLYCVKHFHPAKCYVGQLIHATHYMILSDVTHFNPL